MGKCDTGTAIVSNKHRYHVTHHTLRVVNDECYWHTDTSEDSGSSSGYDEWNDWTVIIWRDGFDCNIVLEFCAVSLRDASQSQLDLVEAFLDAQLKWRISGESPIYCGRGHEGDEEGA